MYRYKVIDIHPDDPNSDSRFADRVSVGDILETKEHPYLHVWNIPGFNVSGYSSGNIGGRCFYAIKVEDITEHEVEPAPWIPVSERMPETSGDVLVWCGDCVDVVYFNVEDRAWDFFGQDYAVEPVITHWMPLPEPPKK